MKNYTLLAFAFVIFAINSTFSQEDLQLTSKDSIVKSSWILGLGFNAVDDSGDVFNDLFAIDSQWNMVPYPSRLSIGRYFKNGLGLEAIGTINKYKEGNLIDGTIINEDISYFGVDARLTYDLNKIIGETAWFDPYIGVGFGYTDANKMGRSTYNAVVGFRTWFSDRWGVDLNSSGKWGIGEGVTNHIQHAAGVVYQFGIEKGLSKKGEEKLAMINALEQERQRIQDSIAAVDRAREEAALAERLAKEKESARLAAIEKAKKDEEMAKRRAIEEKINALGFVYFNFNSSYLTKKSRTVLDSLSIILEENQGLQLEIASHADSRGTAEYNEWLSERRVDRTKTYLVGKGIDPTRLTTKAFGEKHPLNECSDGVKCTEEKHKVNRRSEFKVVKM